MNRDILPYLVIGGIVCGIAAFQSMSAYSDSTTTPANFGLADFLNMQPPNFCPADTYCTYGHFDFKVLSSNNRLPFKYTTVVISADALQFVDQFEHVHHKLLDLSTRQSSQFDQQHGIGPGTMVEAGAGPKPPVRLALIASILSGQTLEIKPAWNKPCRALVNKREVGTLVLYTAGELCATAEGLIADFTINVYGQSAPNVTVDEMRQAGLLHTMSDGTEGFVPIHFRMLIDVTHMDTNPLDVGYR